MLTINRLVAFVVAFAKPKYLRALTPIVGAFFASRKLMYSLTIFACLTLEKITSLFLSYKGRTNGVRGKVERGKVSFQCGTSQNCQGVHEFP